jgi:hypothetical protein
MSSHDIKSLAQLAPSLEGLEEQNVKIEKASASPTTSIDLGALSQNPQLEDFVFFASAQRAAERKEDGAT